jgi:3-oxoadipate enol-lactonase
MPWAEVNGTRLYYEIHGAGPPLLLSHGGGANHVSWWQQLPAFAERYTVITYDHRGFGLSDDNDQTTMALVDDLEGLIEHLGFDQLILLGQSLGGFAAAGVASRHPERIAALVITSSAAGLIPMAPPPGSGSQPTVPTTMPSYLDIRAGMIRRGHFPQRNPTLCLLVEELASFNHRVDVSVLGGTMQVLHDADPIITGGFPVLLVANEEDVAVTEAMRQLHELLPGSELVVVPAADHLVYIEQPEVFNDVVLSFLRARFPSPVVVDQGSH